MKQLLFIICLLGSIYSYAQTTNFSRDYNYIHTRIFTNETGGSYLDEIQYCDVFGRPTQRVQKGITPSGKDLVTYKTYDWFGRENATGLPVPNDRNGLYDASIISKTNTFYSDNYSYYQNKYENSAESRQTEERGPGIDWHEWANTDRSLRYSYLTNASSTAGGTESSYLKCLLYYAKYPSTTLQIQKSGYYNEGELYVAKVIDENLNVIYKFTDKEGKTVLERAINNGQAHDTHYVYDKFGNLCYVLPPLASDALSAAAETLWSKDDQTLKDYAYIYEYDSYNRCIAKKLPGCDWTYYIYDKANRIILTQDGEQRNVGSHHWAFVIPDELGRIAVTGTCTYSGNYKQNPLANTLVTASYNGNASRFVEFKGYDSPFLESMSERVIQNVNLYDQYDFLGKFGFIGLNFNQESGYGSMNATCKGMPTGTATAIIGSPGEFLYSTLYYDIHGQLIQVKSTNHLGGTESEYIAYNFIGNPTQKKHVHIAAGKETQTETYTYSYDNAGRLTQTKHKLNTGTDKILALNTYDEVGRPKTNMKNNNTNLKSTFNYNIRSWTESITSPLFEEYIYYNTQFLSDNKQYNGNIGGIVWKLTGENQRRYVFEYDNLSQLTKARYEVGDGNYESSYSYDKHGNIKTLKRYGKTTANAYGLIDNLTMDYTGTGNQIKSVSDAVGTISLAESSDFKNYSNTATEYFYNKNGAMTKDLNKGVSSIQYNILNLPKQMDIKSPVAEARNVYTYSAGGAKLRVVQKWNPNYSTAPVLGSGINENSLTKTKTTDYAGNIIYESHSDGTTKTKILIDGGYIENGVYHFYLVDHLGNNRVVVDQSGAIIQKNNYYPFGMAFSDNNNAEKQSYKYNGKELDQMHGLNLYDYHARHYDSAIGRFTTIDPHAENYYAWSPYHYAANNPIRITDPTGMDWYEDEDGNKMWRRSRDADYTDSNDKVWKNIGEEHTFVFGQESIRFGQRENKDGELTLFSEKMKTSDSEWFDTGAKAASFLGSLGSASELTEGAFRLTNGAYNGSQISLKYYASGWRGGSRAQIRTYRLSAAGKILGGATFAASTLMNGIGVYNKTVTPEKAMFDFTMGAAAIYNPAFGIPYGLSEAFIPGGFASVVKAYAETRMFHLEMNRKYWWYPVPIIH